MDAVRDAARDYILEAAFDRLASFFGDFFRGKKHYKTQLSELKVKLQSIEALVDDAEQKQFRDKRVREWLLKAKDVVFQIEDLSDEIDCEHSKCEVEAESQSPANKVRSFFKSFSVSSFEKEIESWMKQIRDDLDDLASQIDGLGLKKVKDLGVGSGSGSKLSQKLPSTSSVVESDICGRDDDKEMIFDWLNSDTDKKLSILSIVGMGGLGKTTLAQLVFNDPRIESKFDIKDWICVSDDFDVFKVTRAILDTFTKSTENSDQLQVVHTKLKKKLTGKRFLLILDDVWNENRSKWEAVQNALVCGAQGSMILVTTRSKEVAFAMRSKEHPLEELQEDYCWQLFAKHAFQDDDPQPNPVFTEIGMKIVKKCKGLPLALKTMGSLLHNKSSVPEWESVLQSEIWEFPKEHSDVIPPLALSYHHLPSHLKTCFAYCGLFPKDYEFDKECLIQWWMAENFLHCHQCSKSPEEVGQQYFNDLLSRLEVDQAKSTQKTTRHFSVVINNNEYFDGFGTSCDTKRLRTFMPTSTSVNYHPWHCNMSIHELFSKFKFLRVLSLSYCSDIKEVPNSVCNLKHLRSLDLSKTDIEKLPDSTCSLSNLQILKLNKCLRLKELPLNLHKLTSLSRLEIKDTELRKVPPHLGKLKNLQVLISSFDVGKSSEFTIQQLRELNLHGRLSIGELQNIENPLHALAVGLKNKIHLVELELRWDKDKNPDDSEKERDENVIENLQPSKHLEMLSISNYGGTKFPNWLSDSLWNVVYLTLDNCQSCQCLPSLGLLPFLKELEISGLDGIVSIGADFYGNRSSSFTSLKTLRFSRMEEWEEWECQDVTGAFPCLEHLSIDECPKLKGNLPVQLVRLKTLSIWDCADLVGCAELEFYGQELTIKGDDEACSEGEYYMQAWLVEWIGRMISDTPLEELTISYCQAMNIPTSRSHNFLRSLTIETGCESLMTFPLDSFPTLRRLHLIKCRNLQRISQERAHSHLEYLEISECHQFKSLPERMDILLPSLEELRIRDCPNVELSPDGGLPSNLKTLTLDNCSKFIKLDVESFPDEGLLPVSLTCLSISGCPDLGKLDCKGLYHLSALQKLDLQGCPSLRCLPEGLCQLSSLQELSLQHCPSLECLPEGLCRLSALQKLDLQDCPSLRCLPEGLCQLSSLRILSVQSCDSLQCLPESLCHLSSLEHLFLGYGRSLQCLPEEGLPKSISLLKIWGNDLLIQRCQEGEDREKISHIKRVVFGIGSLQQCWTGSSNPDH